MYRSGFSNPTKDEEAYEPLQSANRRTAIPDFSLIKTVTSQKDIALNLGVSPSTISRELECNTWQRGSRPKQAQIKADRRRQEADKTIKMTFDVVNTIEAKILLDWSPEQVSVG